MGIGVEVQNKIHNFPDQACAFWDAMIKLTVFVRNALNISE